MSEARLVEVGPNDTANYKSALEQAVAKATLAGHNFGVMAAEAGPARAAPGSVSALVVSRAGPPPSGLTTFAGERSAESRSIRRSIPLLSPARLSTRLDEQARRCFAELNTLPPDTPVIHDSVHDLDTFHDLGSAREEKRKVLDDALRIDALRIENEKMQSELRHADAENRRLADEQNVARADFERLFTEMNRERVALLRENERLLSEIVRVAENWEIVGERDAEVARIVAENRKILSERDAAFLENERLKEEVGRISAENQRVMGMRDAVFVENEELLRDISLLRERCSDWKERDRTYAAAQSENAQLLQKVQMHKEELQLYKDGEPARMDEFLARQWTWIERCIESKGAEELGDR